MYRHKEEEKFVRQLKAWEPGYSTIQRKNSGSMEQRINGISNREDAAFTQMYGFSLHDAGVSVKHTSPNDPALTSVGASSLIQGNQIISGNKSDIWHEYAHVPQQLSGQVTANEHINGQAVNTEAKWEQMADRDGAKMKSIANSL